MKEPHNHAHVGYGMIVVAAGLTAIALVALAIGSNVLLEITFREQIPLISKNAKQMISKLKIVKNTGTE